MLGNKRAEVRLAGLIVAAGLALAAPAGSAYAAGDGGGDMPTCKRGEVYNKKLKKCVKQDTAALSDDELTDYAYALAEAGRYDETLAVLTTLHDPNTAKALNYKGFATRKLGRTEEGIGYYLQSVKLDPRYAKVREYLGEAYVIQGRKDLARDQLAAIESICGKACEEYRDLAEAIDG
ncbi:hypothetical protein [Aureimonas leprariae]|uniref:Tetratricopeptide repeat protein n=1 Tax=Plantimonas leprariae TaxID=2615207 RepID=A0A7V7PSZ3_9HYPH|nr:hypothetical protein [Aureimonas leprariae]KAB0682760.1 hypothetical protein F6X38_01370 [Aureimonas leprariae]